MLSDGNSRNGAFERAYRHSRMVRILRVALPVSAVALFATYIVSAQLTIGSQDTGKLTVSVPTISGDKLAMSNPEYAGTNKDGSRFLVRARTAEHDPRQPAAPIGLAGIEARVVQPDATLTVMKSPRGTYDVKSGVLELYDEIDIAGETGLKAFLSRATVLTKEGRISSAEPVAIEMPAGQIRSNAIAIDQKKREIAFSGGVAARLNGAAPSGRTAKAETAPKADAASIQRSNEPIDVQAQRLDIDDTAKLAVFRGLVKARQGEALIEAPELEIAYTGNPGTAATAPAAGGAVAADAPAGRVKRMVARQNVVITRSGETARAREAEFASEAEIAKLTGGVLLTSPGNRQATGDSAEIDTRAERTRLIGNIVISGGPDQRATADLAELDQKAQTAVLTGREVVVSQGRNSLRGRRLVVDRKSGTTEMTNPGARIAAQFWRPEQTSTAAAGKTDQRATPFGDGGGFTIKTDPTAPISVEADSLTSQDATRTATFRGAVKAVQGTFRLETPELVATYSGDVSIAGDAGLSGGQSAAGGAKEKKDGPPPELQRIRANRAVKVTSTDDQTVTGDWADFDVKANTITIGGKVLISQGTTRIHATKVVVDMTTGRTNMEAVPTTGAVTSLPPLPEAGKPTFDAAKARAAAIAAGNCGGRPCLMVYPNQLKERVKRKAEELVPGTDIDAKLKQGEAAVRRALPGAASSWEAVTSPQSRQSAN